MGTIDAGVEKTVRDRLARLQDKSVPAPEAVPADTTQ